MVFQSSLAPTEREHGERVPTTNSVYRFNPLSLQRSESTGVEPWQQNRCLSFNPLSLQRSESTFIRDVFTGYGHVSILSRSNGARAPACSKNRHVADGFQSSLAPTEREHR